MSILPDSVAVSTDHVPASMTKHRRSRGACRLSAHECSSRAGRPCRLNSPRHVLVASLIGTTIEFFDFYIYATAAVIVFPKLFFPTSDPASATLASLATFAIAFFARPIGSAIFGHFGDRIGRKATLVAALLTMGAVDGDDRHAANLHDDRHCGARAAGALPLRSGARARRRMGRSGAARGRERAPGQARVVRNVSATGRAARLPLLWRNFPAPVVRADGRGNSSRSDGGFRFSRARCSWASASTSG